MATTGDGELRFDQAAPAGQTSIEVSRADLPPDAKPHQILEQAFVQLTSTPENRELYGDPTRGATLLQAWRTRYLLSGIHSWCLLAAGNAPRVSAESITKLVVFDPQALVGALAQLLVTRGDSAVQVAEWDGQRGHSISLVRFDEARQRFLYHDPWPGDSLLSAAYNHAGVAARREAGGLWSLTPAELARVIVAAFVFPGEWAEISGITAALEYDDLLHSEFFEFFNVRVEAEEGSGRSRTVHLRTGGFTDQVELRAVVDRGRVTSASLALRGSFVVGPPYGVNPFALDIAKSFLSTFASPADHAAVAPFVAELWSVQDRAALEQKVRDPAFESSPPGQLIGAYLGLAPSAAVVFDFGRLELQRENRAAEGADDTWLTLRWTLW